MKGVKKAWGREVIIVNDEYSAKLLHLDKAAESSLHKHLKKKETFFCLEGQVALIIEGKDYMLHPYSRPKTIHRGKLHSFRGITKATILEIATHDDPKDTYRLTESKPGE